MYAFLPACSEHQWFSRLTSISEDGRFSAISISLWSLEVSLFILKESHGWWYQMQRFCISHPWLNLLFPFSLVWIELDLGQGRFYPVVNPSASSSHFPGNTFSSFEPNDSFPCPLINCKLYTADLLWHLAGKRDKCCSPEERKKVSHFIVPHLHWWSRENCPRVLS